MNLFRIIGSMSEVVEIVDLTDDTEFESCGDPFQNEDDPVLEIGHNYNLRSRVAFKLNKLKMLIKEMEHDLVIGPP